MEVFDAFGVVPLAVEPERYEVWADNWPALSLFMHCNTQWVISERGRECLRYEALPFLMKTYGVKKKARADMLTDIKTCERTALDCWSKKRGR